MKKYCAFLLALLLFCLPCLPCVAAEAQEGTITILFTTDIHSNLVPHQALVDGEGAHVGGFARLASAIQSNNRDGNAILLDSGDFSTGTMYQSFCVTDALELRLLAQLGYSAVALGNHDFEFGEDGLKDELTLLKNSGSNMAVLCTNLTTGAQPSQSRLDNPLSDVGVANYTIINRNGVKIGVFALMGEEAEQYTPTQTLTFADPVKTAKATVKVLREEEKVDLVILLSHSGYVPGTIYQEDAQIAKSVDGIDVILSGHSHYAMQEAEVINGTIIGAAGTALANLGKMEITKTADGWALSSYQLISIDDTWPEDETIAAQVAPYTQELQALAEKRYGLDTSLFAPVAYSSVNLPSGDDMAASCQPYGYGRLLTDAYMHTLSEMNISADVAIVPVGTVRNGLYSGELTVMDVYNILSYGESPLDGTSGAPILTVCITGRELYDICETSVSLSSIVSAAQMFFGGLRYTYSTTRPILDRVYRVEVFNKESGAYEEVKRDDSTLYTVAVSYTTVESIAMVGKNSFGLLSAVPKDENGNVLTREQLKNRIITYNVKGTMQEMKEWYALYSFLLAQPVNSQGLHLVDDSYVLPADFMANTSVSFTGFFQNPSKAFWLMALVVIVVVLLVVLLVFLVRRRIRRHKKTK